MFRKRKWILLALVAILVSIGTAWWIAAERERKDPGILTLYGNIDVRQVNLGFRVAGRILSLAVDEGDRVKTGDIIATLDRATYFAALKGAEAQLAKAQAQLEKMQNGSRLEEIEQAAAAVKMFQAAERNAIAEHKRNTKLITTDAVARKDFDSTLAKEEETHAQVELASAKWRELKAGYRQEDIAAAKADLKAAEANVLARTTDLDDTVLKAPSDGVIQTRVHELGAIVAAGTTLFTLTLNRPVWVRAYVSEPDLGKIRPGMEVTVRNDSSTKVYEGHVGFISPAAEFTPKSVETASLRTDLVYRIRIVVKNPGEYLRQGMPVTVTVKIAK